MIQTNAIEGVEECKTTLDLVGLHHTLQKITNFQGLSFAGEMIRDSKDSAKVVRRVAPCQSEIVSAQKQHGNIATCSSAATPEIENTYTQQRGNNH